MTNRKRLVAVVMLMLVTCLMVAWLSETAYAGEITTKEADKKKSGEVSMMEKKGIEGVFAGKSFDSDKAPTRIQKFMGIGSIVVMIAVLKYV